MRKISSVLEFAKDNLCSEDCISLSFDAFSSGFNDLDRAMGGVRRGSLYLLRGAAGIGKTSFSLCLTDNIAVKQPLGVLYFSGQTDTVNLTKRLIKLIGKIEWMNKEDINPEDVDEAVEKLRGSKIYISDYDDIVDADIIDQKSIERLKGKIDMVIIDSLDESVNSDIDWNDYLVDCKMLAKTMNCAVLVTTTFDEKKDVMDMPENYISLYGFSPQITKYVDYILTLGWYEGIGTEPGIRNIAELKINRKRRIGTKRVKFVVLEDMARYVGMSI